MTYSCERFYQSTGKVDRRQFPGWHPGVQGVLQCPAGRGGAGLLVAYLEISDDKAAYIENEKHVTSDDVYEVLDTSPRFFVRGGDGGKNTPHSAQVSPRVI